MPWRIVPFSTTNGALVSFYLFSDTPCTCARSAARMCTPRSACASCCRMPPGGAEEAGEGNLETTRRQLGTRPRSLAAQLLVEHTVAQNNHGDQGDQGNQGEQHAPPTSWELTRRNKTAGKEATSCGDGLVIWVQCRQIVGPTYLANRAPSMTHIR